MSSAGLKAEGVQTQRYCVKGRLGRAVASLLLLVFVRADFQVLLAGSWCEAIVHACITGWSQRCRTIKDSKAVCSLEMKEALEIIAPEFSVLLLCTAKWLYFVY